MKVSKVNTRSRIVLTVSTARKKRLANKSSHIVPCKRHAKILSTWGYVDFFCRENHLINCHPECKDFKDGT